MPDESKVKITVERMLSTFDVFIDFVPVLASIAIRAGVHPLHIWIIIVFNLVLGMMTPPLGLGLFCGCRVGKVGSEKNWNLLKGGDIFVFTIKHNTTPMGWS